MPNQPSNPFRREMYDSLESFVDHVSELLGCPITLEDTHHRVLVYSSHNEETDPVRISTIISRRVPEKVINRLWKDGVIPSLLQSKKPIRIEGKQEIGLGSRVAVSIWRADEVIGYIWAIELHQALTASQMDILENAAAVGKHLLSRFAKAKRPSTNDDQEFFWRLLTGHVNKQEAEEKLMEINQTALNNYTIMVFTFKEIITKEMEKQIIYLLKVMDNVKISLYTMDDHELILLASAINRQDSPAVVFKQFIRNFPSSLAEKFQITDVYGGYGSIYTDLKDVEKCLKEAKKVIEVKAKFPGEAQAFSAYQDLGIYQFMDVLLEKRIQDGFENIAIQKLRKYDKSHNTDLLLTLEAFLDESESMQKTALKLHIHTNTLTYRLKRITEIMEVDLSVPSQKFMLYLDLKLLRWHQK